MFRWKSLHFKAKTRLLTTHLETLTPPCLGLSPKKTFFLPPSFMQVMEEDALWLECPYQWIIQPQGLCDIGMTITSVIYSLLLNAWTGFCQQVQKKPDYYDNLSLSSFFGGEDLTVTTTLYRTLDKGGLIISVDRFYISYFARPS